MGQKMDRGGGSMAASYFKALTVGQSGNLTTSTTHRADWVTYNLTMCTSLFITHGIQSSRSFLLSLGIGVNEI